MSFNVSSESRNRWLARYSRIPQRFGEATVFLILLGYTLLLYREFLEGKALYWGDILYYFQPMAHFAAREIRQGRLPLWNPFLLCGQPYAGNPQIGLLYPFSFLLLWLSPWKYITLAVLIHTYLASLFFYGFLKLRTQSAYAALIGAIVFVGSGAFLGKAQFPPMLFSLCYLPGVFYSAEKALHVRKPLSILQLTLIVGLLVLAAHPQVTYLTFLLLGAYLLFRLRELKTASAPVKLTACDDRQTLRGCVAGVVGGILLSSCQLLPVLQLAFDSSREHLTPWQANRFVLHPLGLLTLLFPHFFGSPADADYWGAGNAWEVAVFIGWIPLLFIGYALLFWRRSADVRFWLGALLLALWMSFGIMGGLFWVAFYVLPGISLFHDPARFLIIFHFAACSLAAYGYNAYLSRKQKTGEVYITCLFVILTALPLVYYSTDWLPMVSPDRLAHIQTPIPPSATSRIYTPEHATYWNRFVTEGYADYGETSRRFLQLRLRTLLPNLNMDVNLPSASAYEPVPIAAAARVDGMVRVALFLGEPNAARLASLMNVSTLLLPRIYHLSSPWFIAARRSSYGPLRTYLNLYPHPQVWTVKQLLVADNPMRQEAIMASPHFDPLRQAVVKRILPQWERNSVIASKSVVAETMWESPDRLSVFLKTTHPTFVVCSITAQPGWHATESGHDIAIYSADMAFMGFPLGPGAHHICLTYRPSTFTIGSYVSLLTLSVLIGIAISQYIRKWRSTLRAVRN
ncbi:MAG TPA: YfhO family protein [Chthonomonas sp.]|uniref:YfhO family protein n=1 Tax=Chthonomonas sp. TaxID=2282153 RepID=UPI002B4B69C2|nr:YfhO family protein [Chthonomonas sp.]HLI48831.1 YfhO family protein [Chthonomonas sp.]